jgi:hypothetical protein
MSFFEQVKLDNLVTWQLCSFFAVGMRPRKLDLYYFMASQFGTCIGELVKVLLHIFSSALQSVNDYLQLMLQIHTDRGKFKAMALLIAESARLGLKFCGVVVMCISDLARAGPLRH